MSRFASDWIDRTTIYKRLPDVDGTPFYTLVDRPLIVTLIGSSRFKSDHERVLARLGLEGKIGIGLTQYGHCTELDMEGQEKADLDKLHLYKIDLADVVYVVNPVIEVCESCKKPCETFVWPRTRTSHSDCCNANTKRVAYIGDSTKRELAYARQHVKVIEADNPLGDE